MAKAAAPPGGEVKDVVDFSQGDAQVLGRTLPDTLLAELVCEEGDN